MFLQRTTSGRGNKKYVCWLVREGYRTEKGPRSRTVCNVTGLPEEGLEALRLALQGKHLVPLEELALDDAFDYGGLAVVRATWQRLGLDGLFEEVPSARQRGLLKALVFARLLFPSSKLALAEQAHGTLLAAACGLDPTKESFDEDDLYAAMDALNGRWVALEKQLYRKAFEAPLRVVLYDLTSVYFEGKGPRRLARFGYSRDHRTDRRQVVLAVAANKVGIPLHVEVLKGNRGDATTFKGLLATLQRRFGIEEAVFAFDGGVNSKVNLAAIEAERLQYVTRLSKAQLGSLLKKLPEDRQPELFDCTELIDIVHAGVRYVIAGGEERRHRDRDRREVRLAKAEAALVAMADVPRKKVDPPNRTGNGPDRSAQKLASQAGRTLQRLKAHKYFDYDVDENGTLQWSRKESVIDEEARLDGWYLLQTNLVPEDGDKREVLSHYKQLMEVEAAFRELKDYLKVRPVYHRRIDRVRNHIRICFIAYWLSACLSAEWKAKGETRRVVAILRALQKIRIGVFSLAGKRVARLMTQVPPEQNQTLSRLDLLALYSKPPAWAKL